MIAGTQVSEWEYLHTDYELDCEFADGVLIERNVGTKDHSWLQTRLAGFFLNRRKAWVLMFTWSSGFVFVRADT